MDSTLKGTVFEPRRVNVKIEAITYRKELILSCK